MTAAKISQMSDMRLIGGPHLHSMHSRASAGSASCPLAVPSLSGLYQRAALYTASLTHAHSVQWMFACQVLGEVDQQVEVSQPQHGVLPCNINQECMLSAPLSTSGGGFSISDRAETSERMGSSSEGESFQAIAGSQAFTTDNQHDMCPHHFLKTSTFEAAGG